MLSYQDLKPHFEVRYKAPSGILERCWLIILDGKVADPSEEVSANDSPDEE